MRVARHAAPRVAPGGAVEDLRLRLDHGLDVQQLVQHQAALVDGQFGQAGHGDRAGAEAFEGDGVVEEGGTGDDDGGVSGLAASRVELDDPDGDAGFAVV